MRRKQQIRRGVVFACILVVGVVALQFLLTALDSPDQQVQQLVQKIFAVGGLGAVILMGVTLMTRVDDPRKR